MIYVLIPMDANIPKEYHQRCFDSLNEASAGELANIMYVVQIGNSLPGETEYVKSCFDRLQGNKIFFEVIKGEGVPNRVRQLEDLMNHVSVSDDDWVTFVDADDQVCPNFFHAIPNDYKIDAVLLERLRVLSDGKYMTKPYLNYSALTQEHSRDGWWGNVLWGAFFKWSLILKVFKDMDGSSLYSRYMGAYGSELVLCSHLNEEMGKRIKNGSIIYVDDISYYWIERPNSISVSDMKKRINILKEICYIPDKQKIQFFLFNVKMIYKVLSGTSGFMAEEFLKGISKESIYSGVLDAMCRMEKEQPERFLDYLFLSEDENEGKLGLEIFDILKSSYQT